MHEQGNNRFLQWTLFSIAVSERVLLRGAARTIFKVSLALIEVFLTSDSARTL